MKFFSDMIKRDTIILVGSVHQKSHLCCSTSILLFNVEYLTHN